MPLDLTRKAESDFHRRHALGPDTFDAETMTVEATIATASPVQRRDTRGTYLEVLTPNGLDIDTVKGVSVVDNHRMASSRDVIGVVESARVDGTSIVARLRFSSADDAAPIVARVADGTLTGVSVGYRVQEWRETTVDGHRVRSPARWTISEVSLTPNPADPHARLRSTEKESSMPDDVLELPAPDDAEKTRRSEIRTLTRSAGLPSEFADDLIDTGADLIAAKAAIFDKTTADRGPRIRSIASATNDDPTVVTRRQSDALAYRMGGSELPEDAREYVETSMLDMARSSLQRSGQSVRGLTIDETLHRAAHTTSDFPLVVSNAVNKTALSAFQAAESPLKTLCRQQTLPNFKASTAIRVGETSNLERVAETGESMQVETYARRIDVSRNLIINDDLNLLGDMTAEFGRAAAETEAQILVALITSNPDLSDGTPVFDFGRGNIASSGATISETTLSEARLSMRGRKGLDGVTLITATPRYVLVGPALETEAEKVLTAIQANTTADVNPFGGKLSLLVDPRITGNEWYVFADPARLASLRYAYLGSAQGVQVQRREAWDTLGMSFRAWLDFGAGWIDWRGAEKNPGA